MDRDPGERPERLLARLGVASRREVARWLAAGRLALDGRVLRGGERVPAGGRLTLDGRPLRLPRAPPLRRVVAYHKPVGEIVTRRDPQGRPSVFAALPPLEAGRWVSVGRLDVATTGLLLFTSDGDLAARLMHPRGGLERRYLVRAHGRLAAADRARLTAGIELEDGPARLETCEPLPGAPSGRNHWYRVSLREGRNREVRRLFAGVGLEVSRLKRIGFGPIELSRALRPGTWRELAAPEIAALEAACS